MSKSSKIIRFLSVLLSALMLVSLIPLNYVIAESGDTAAEKNGLVDWIWDIFHKTSVSVEGLPEGAVPSIEQIPNPFTRKSGGTSVGSFLGFYDIKATDKETGKEIHPNGEFEVRLQGVKLEKDQSVYVIHVLDTEDAIKNTPNVRFIDDAGFVNAFKDQASLTEKTTGRKGSVAVEVIEDVTVDGSDLSFKTNSFSIYIIANNPRINVVFHNGDEILENVVIKFSDLDSLDLLIYDVPIDTHNNEGIMFRGWTQNANYTNPDSALSIQGVRAEVRQWLVDNQDAISSGTTLDYYAMLFKHYVVSYFDERSAVCLGRDSFLYRADGADGAIGEDGTIDYRINMSYVPSNEGQAFLGWTINTGSSAEFAEYSDNLVSVFDSATNQYTTTIPSIIDNPIMTKIKGDVYLKAVAPVGNWLVFEENGKGAKYNAPQFVETDAVTQRPCPDSEMTRLGYTFGGWFYSQQIDNITVIDESRPFTFGGTISEKTTIFAKWNENSTANYTVIIWTQNLNGDTVKTKYDFAQSIHLNGNVGDTIVITPYGDGIRIPGTTYTVTSSTSNGYYIIVDNNGNYVEQYLYYNNGRWYREHNWWWSEYTGIVYDLQTSNTLTLTGFHYDSHDTNVKIATEGDSVVNVYFDRTEYTFTFRDGNRTIHTVTRKFGTDISDIWSFTGTNGKTYPQTSPATSWTPSGSSTYTQRITRMEIMPAENITFKHTTTTNTTRYFHYYVEALPGASNTITYNGKQYSLYVNLPNDFNIVYYNDDFWNLNGFTRQSIAKGNTDATTFYNVDLNPGDNISWTNLNNNYSGQNNHLYFFYTRDHFDITFFDGGYFDGNGNPIDEILLGEFDTGYGKEILYNADIVNYNKSGTVVEHEGEQPKTSNGANYFKPEREGYVFEGWFVDDRCTTPLIFDTMNGAIKAYAKWRQIQYRVFLRPDTDVGEGKTASEVISVDPTNGLWGTQSQDLNFRISYNDKVSLPTGVDANHIYEFGGWYLDPEYKHPFSGNEKLNDSLSDYFEEYTKIGEENYTDVMNQWGHDATWNSDIQDEQGNPRDRFWITEKLELYALWRRVLDGAEGLKVIYDFNDGDSVDDEDPDTYDHCDGHIYQDRANSFGLAAPEPIVSEGKTYYFRYWVIQQFVESQDGGEGGYFPAVTIGDEPSNIAESRIVYPGEQFRVDATYSHKIAIGGGKNNYFTHLIAVYTESIPEKTTVKYDTNEGVWKAANGSLLISTQPVTYLDASNNHVAYTYVNDQNETVQLLYSDKGSGQYGFEIEVNKDFDILVNDENNPLITRKGYTFLGWATIEAKNLTAEQFLQALEADEESDPQYEHRYHVFKGDGTDPEVAADKLGTPNSETNTLYAIWESAPVGDLIINKAVVDASGAALNTGLDSFLFKIEREVIDTPAEGETEAVTHWEFVQTVLIHCGNAAGTGTVTIKNLELGKYRVTEITGWSWAYDFKTAEGFDSNGAEKELVLWSLVTETNPATTFNFKNQANGANWLKGETSNENIFANPAPAAEATPSD